MHDGEKHCVNLSQSACSGGVHLQIDDASSCSYPDIGFTGVAMLLEPEIALLGVIPMSTDSTSKAIGGLPKSCTSIS